MSYDIGNYVHDASFQYEIYPGAVQVPVCSLGQTRYTNEDMADMARLPVEERRKLIGNLYEAIQLFQAAGFRGRLDNHDEYVGGVHWQTHQGPEAAVSSNEGCCATDTNWLSYFLKDRYDAIGSFCFGHADQNGHITTCIMHGGLHYFIDMMMCRRDSQPYFDREDVPPEKRQSPEWAGLLYACEDPVQMCRFYTNRFHAMNRLAPYCYYLRRSDHITATGCGCDAQHIVTFYAPACDQPQLLFLEPASPHRFSIVPLPDFSAT